MENGNVFFSRMASTKDMQDAIGNAKLLKEEEHATGQQARMSSKSSFAKSALEPRKAHLSKNCHHYKPIIATLFKVVCNCVVLVSRDVIAAELVDSCCVFWTIVVSAFVIFERARLVYSIATYRSGQQMVWSVHFHLFFLEKE